MLFTLTPLAIRASQIRVNKINNKNANTLKRTKTSPYIYIYLIYPKERTIVYIVYHPSRLADIGVSE